MIRRVIRWRRISPWCWSAVICGVECRVWLSADDQAWHAGHEHDGGRMFGEFTRRRFADRHEARRTVAKIVRTQFGEVSR